MSGYTVISSDMPRTSSLNLLPCYARWVWLYLLTIQRDGEVEGVTPSTVALGCHVTIKEAGDALDLLCKPDPGSKNVEAGGARLEKLGPGHYRLVAFNDYSNLIKRVSDRKRKQTQRKGAEFSEELVANFEEFWTHYPRRRGTSKKDARIAYAKAVKRGATVADLAKAAKLMGDNAKKNGIEDRYVPHAATWLNQDRYETWLEVDKKEGSNVNWHW